MRRGRTAGWCPTASAFLFSLSSWAAAQSTCAVVDVSPVVSLQPILVTGSFSSPTVLSVPGYGLITVTAPTVLSTVVTETSTYLNTVTQSPASSNALAQYTTVTELYDGVSTLVTTISPSGIYPGTVIVELPSLTGVPPAITEGYDGSSTFTTTISGTPIVFVPTSAALAAFQTVTEFYDGSSPTVVTVSGTVIVELPLATVSSNPGAPFQYFTTSKPYPGTVDSLTTILPTSGSVATVINNVPFATTTIVEGYPGSLPETVVLYPTGTDTIVTVIVETPTSALANAFQTTTITQGYPGLVPTTVTVFPTGTGDVVTVVVETPTTALNAFQTTLITEGYPGSVLTTVLIFPTGTDNVVTEVVETPQPLFSTLQGYNQTTTVFEGYPGPVPTTVLLYPTGSDGIVTEVIETPLASSTAAAFQTTTIVEEYPGSVATTILLYPTNSDGLVTEIIETPSSSAAAFATTTVTQGYPGLVLTTATLFPTGTDSVVTVVVETPFVQTTPPVAQTVTLTTAYTGAIPTTVFTTGIDGIVTELIETPFATVTETQDYPGAVPTTIYTTGPDNIVTEIIETPFATITEDQGYPGAAPTTIYVTGPDDIVTEIIETPTAGYLTEPVLYTGTSQLTEPFFTTIADPSGTVPGTVLEEELFAGPTITTVVDNAAVATTFTLFPTDISATEEVVIEIPPTSAAQIQYVTETIAWTGAVITTTTLFPTDGGLIATVEILTPGVVTPTSVAPLATVTEVVTGGSTFGTTTIPAVGPSGTTIVEVSCPVPDTSCGNSGLDYAIFNNLTPGDLTPTYESFDPNSYEQQVPLGRGVTSAININFGTDDTMPTIYGITYTEQTLVALHVGYLYACQSGNYIFYSPNSDDVSFLWLGEKAYTLWTRSNIDAQQFFYGVNTPQSVSVYLNAGEYLPFRTAWANTGGEGTQILNIVDPNGNTISSADIASQFLVTNSCDGSAPAFQPLGL